MKRISSRWTFIYKRLSPFFGLGIAAGLVVAGAFSHRLAVMLAGFGVALSLALINRKVFSSAADEVFDGNDHLLVRSGRVEARIELSNVATIEPMWGSEVIRMRLREPSPLGTTIVFFPWARSISFLARHPVLVELSARLDDRRRAPQGE